MPFVFGKFVEVPGRLHWADGIGFFVDSSMHHHPCDDIASSLLSLRNATWYGLEKSWKIQTESQNNGKKNHEH